MKKQYEVSRATLSVIENHLDGAIEDLSDDNIDFVEDLLKDYLHFFPYDTWDLVGGYAKRFKEKKGELGL